MPYLHREIKSKLSQLKVNVQIRTRFSGGRIHLQGSLLSYAIN